MTEGLLKPGSKFEKELEVCAECCFPTVEEIDHVPSAKAETKYYCSTCQSWNEGSPSIETHKLEVVE